jgi:hypothetical protein
MGLLLVLVRVTVGGLDVVVWGLAVTPGRRERKSKEIIAENGIEDILKCP